MRHRIQKHPFCFRVWHPGARLEPPFTHPKKGQSSFPMPIGCVLVTTPQLVDQSKKWLCMKLSNPLGSAPQGHAGAVARGFQEVRAFPRRIL